MALSISPYQVTTQVGYGMNAGPFSGWFGPLQPPAPTAPPDTAGRVLDYPSGYNLSLSPRPYEPIGYAQLRALADSYDLLRLVIETRKDQLTRMPWNIKKRGQTVRYGSTLGETDPEVTAIEDFFSMPDRENTWEAWLRQLLEDLFVIDAPTLWIERARNGSMYSLVPIDGSTIKRVITDRGRTPQPPLPAYQQILKGLPAVDYTTREMIYRPRNIRTNRLFGYSPVEQIILTVNIALRRQVYQLQYYTEGNMPEALVGAPETWTPQQIKDFQEAFDAMMSGDTGARRHIKFVPSGIGKLFIPTKEEQLFGSGEEWLARVTCFAFSISPLPFVQMMNRGTSETAQEAAITEGLYPVMSWVKGLADHIIWTEFRRPDLEFKWASDVDPNSERLTRTLDTQLQRGVITINEFRDKLGEDPIEGGDVNMVWTGTGPIPLADLIAPLDTPLGQPGASAPASDPAASAADVRGDGGAGDPAASVTDLRSGDPAATARQLIGADPAATADQVRGDGDPAASARDLRARGSAGDPAANADAARGGRPADDAAASADDVRGGSKQSRMELSADEVRKNVAVDGLASAATSGRRESRIAALRSYRKAEPHARSPAEGIRKETLWRV